MTDLIDRAEQEIEMELADALRQRKPSGPQSCGVCLYCDAVLRDGLRWCGPECRDGWEADGRREVVDDD